VKADSGAEACRAFILEAPAQFAGSVSVYEHDMAPIRVGADEADVTLCPESMVATEDGVLYVAAVEYVSTMHGIVPSLMRSDDHGSSWTPVPLPRPLLGAHLAAGDGKVFVMGVQGDVPFNASMLDLYSMDESTGAFTLLGSYDEDEINFKSDGKLAYVNGNLYLVDMRLGAEDMSVPSHLCVQRFSDDYKTATEPYLLTCDFPCYGVSSVKSAVVGNSIYVLGAVEHDPNGLYADKLSLTAAASDQEALGRTLVGLERVDIAADGTLTKTNLSDTLVGIPALGIDGEDIGFAACKKGVFLVSSVLAKNLPAGSERTDTFVLKSGADKFEPYTKTLSYAPTTMPIAVCSPDGWLYAFAVSDYEDTTIFGRATKVASAEPEPEPTPEPTPEPKPEPTPEPKPQPKPSDNTNRRSSRSTIPATGDPAAAMVQAEALLALVGLTCVAFGLASRRD
jgi:hypothetical protein